MELLLTVMGLLPVMTSQLRTFRLLTFRSFHFPNLARPLQVLNVVFNQALPPAEQSPLTTSLSPTVPGRAVIGY